MIIIMNRIVMKMRSELGHPKETNKSRVPYFKSTVTCHTWIATPHDSRVTGSPRPRAPTLVNKRILCYGTYDLY